VVAIRYPKRRKHDLSTLPFLGSYSETDSRSYCDALTVRSFVKSEVEGKCKDAGRGLI